MDNENPPGALQTIEEVKVLVQRAQAGETVKVYPVSFSTGKPAVGDLTPSKVISLIRNNGGLVVKRDSSETTAVFNLVWRGIGDNSGCSGYLFTNYWHAYAFSLQCQKKR